MWIVRLALRRPYTFVVMAVLIAILGGAAIVTMPVDIFPYIDIPVVSVVWAYGGLTPEEMEKRMVTIFERSMTTTVNDIEHIESQSYSGVSVTRVYFQPNAKVEMALSQVTAICANPAAHLPARHHPSQHHQIRRFERAHPAIGPGKQDPERTGTVRPGPELHPHPAGHHPGRGGAARPTAASSAQVMVDLDPDQLYAQRPVADGMSNALGNQNLILPAGDAKIGDRGLPGEAQQQPARPGPDERHADRRW